MPHGFDVGLPVVDRNGAHLGVISEAFGAIFKLHVPGGRDLWLGADVVEGVDPTYGVSLTISKGDLRLHEIKLPAAS